MVAIGRSLRAKGFEVVISLAEPYAAVARQAGLQVESVVDEAQFRAVLSNQNVWKPIRGARAVMRDLCAEFLTLHDEVIRRHHRPGETVLISHPLDLASRVFRELDPKTPLIDIHLAPAILRTPRDPPRLSPFWFEPWLPGWAIRTVYFVADHLAIDPLVLGPLNRLRRNHGLAPVRRVLDQWWLSPDRIIAMYPHWFAPATEGFLPQLAHAGFPLDDADGSDFPGGDENPIVFTAGTAHHHCRKHFTAAAEVCRRLDHPGLLLSTHAENFPAELPGCVQTAGYAPFGKLLPRCTAIVHHGGIGTTSQALAAGIPQVIRPHAFDQFDNATRVETLGCGSWLRRERDLESSLRKLLSDGKHRHRCAEVAGRLRATGGADVAADLIVKDFDEQREHIPAS